MLSIVLLYMYVLSKISHTFKPNQAPNGFQCRLHHFQNVPAHLQRFVLHVLVHKMPKIFIWNAFLELISHHLPWKRQSTYKRQNSIPLGYVDKIMTESIRPLWEMMLTCFQFLKSSGYMCNLCCQNETSLPKFGQMSISGLLYASCLVLLIDRNNIANYLTVIRYQHNNRPDTNNL